VPLLHVALNADKLCVHGFIGVLPMMLPLFMESIPSSITVCSDDFIVVNVQGSTRLTFKIATRGLLGLKNALLSATRGMGLLNTLFDSYRPVAGNISMRENGSLVAFETGQVRAVCMQVPCMINGGNSMALRYTRRVVFQQFIYDRFVLCRRQPWVWVGCLTHCQRSLSPPRTHQTCLILLRNIVTDFTI
jgi:hypothetical protein